MRYLKSILLALPIVSLFVLNASDASACGGCGVQQFENTQVTGHRMILSIAQESTTLWDQIEYSGNPKDFGWMLPIKGDSGFVLETDFNVSSDALFGTLSAITEVIVSSPQISCPQPNCFGSGAAGGSDNAGSGGAGGSGGVTVIAEKVAGPYQVVHLKANQPNALQIWLAENNYYIPPQVSPVIDAYQAEQFDFIAVKLVPGQGVNSMRPVRIKMPGATAVLPLRMVAVGTGAVTSITLWVAGEGRYEPANFPSFEIQEKDLVWNWDTSSSNYKTLREKGFEATDGRGWLAETAEPVSRYSIQYPLEDLVNYDPLNSGYGDEEGVGANDQLYADLEALYANIDESSMWLTRLHAELPRSALAEDLTVGAASNQTLAQRFFQAGKTEGTPPACPPVAECLDPPDDGNDTWEGYSGSGSAGSTNGCSMRGESGSSAALGSLALCAALALTRRRRTDRRRA